MGQKPHKPNNNIQSVLFVVTLIFDMPSIKLHKINDISCQSNKNIRLFWIFLCFNFDFS